MIHDTITFRHGPWEVEAYMFVSVSRGGFDAEINEMRVLDGITDPTALEFDIGVLEEAALDAWCARERKTA